jgi:hypothetical protein
MTGMRVSLPGIDGEAARVGAEAGHRLAKRKIGIARMGAEFDEVPRAERLDQPKSERDMADPGVRRDQPHRVPGQRILEIEHFLLLAEMVIARIGHQRAGSVAIYVNKS